MSDFRRPSLGSNGVRLGDIKLGDLIAQFSELDERGFVVGEPTLLLTLKVADMGRRFGVPLVSIMFLAPDRAFITIVGPKGRIDDRLCLVFPKV